MSRLADMTTGERFVWTSLQAMVEADAPAGGNEREIGVGRARRGRRRKDATRHLTRRRRPAGPSTVPSSRSLVHSSYPLEPVSSLSLPLPATTKAISSGPSAPVCGCENHFAHRNQDRAPTRKGKKTGRKALELRAQSA